MTASINASLHTDTDTEIKRGLPNDRVPGGWVTIGGDTRVDIFGPHDTSQGVDFWTYLSNVASDMADYCRAREGK